MWKLVGLVGLYFLVLPAFTQSVSTPTHGTINVILANSHGAVVLADSRISSNGKPRGERQKLFKLDDKTVCVIAGFYSDLGPLGAGGHPAGLSIPYLLGLYAQESARRKPQSFEDKMLELESIFGYQLSFLAASRESAVGISEVTMVGYDAGSLKIQGFRLDKSGNGTFNVEADVSPIIVVGKTLQWRIAGIRNVAEPRFSHPELFMQSSSSTVRYLSENLKSDSGASLTTDDMLQIAKRSAVDTSSVYPNIVGGSLQYAVLEGGSIETYEQPVPSSSDLPQRYVNVFDGLVATWAKSPSMTFSFDPNMIALIRNAKVTYSNYALDNVVTVQSRFDHSVLRFDGSPLTVFAPSNEVIDSELVLGPHVSSKDVFVQEILNQFPGLKLQENK